MTTPFPVPLTIGSAKGSGATSLLLLCCYHDAKLVVCGVCSFSMNGGESPHGSGHMHTPGL